MTCEFCFLDKKTRFRITAETGPISNESSLVRNLYSQGADIIILSRTSSSCPVVQGWAQRSSAPGRWCFLGLGVGTVLCSWTGSSPHGCHQPCPFCCSYLLERMQGSIAICLCSWLTPTSGVLILVLPLQSDGGEWWDVCVPKLLSAPAPFGSQLLLFPFLIHRFFDKQHTQSKFRVLFVLSLTRCLKRSFLAYRRFGLLIPCNGTLQILSLELFPHWPQMALKSSNQYFFLNSGSFKLMFLWLCLKSLLRADLPLFIHMVSRAVILSWCAHVS